MTRALTDERGESLVELLTTIVILGLTGATVVGGLLTSVQMSDVHRKQATGGAYARDLAESVARHVAGGGYIPCSGTGGQPTYSPAFSAVTVPAGYKPPTTSVRYWDPSWAPGNTATPWLTTCTTASDPGLQQVTVSLESADGRATEESVVVVRKP